MKNHAEQISMLALAGLKGVGNKTIANLIRQFGCASAILAADRLQLESAGARPALIRALDSLSVTDNELMEKAKEKLYELDEAKVATLTLGSDLYPPLLAEIPDPPPVLYVKGKTDLLHLPQIAIVGSRNASLGASRNAESIAKSLSDASVVVTSGFALGVDTAAHNGALAGSTKGTIAVMGTGVDKIYPARNRDLYERIQETGAIVSEFPLGTGPQRSHFPSRNRIISGLSMGVLVVEAGIKSGSLITAKTALEQDREVFAIPGSIHNPLAKGCHQLIKQGAKLTEDVFDILEELDGVMQYHYSLFNNKGMSLSPKNDEKSDEGKMTTVAKQIVNKPEEICLSDPQKDLFVQTESDQSILNVLGSDVLSSDDIIFATGESPASVLEKLFDLELAGMIECVSGGYRRLKS